MAAIKDSAGQIITLSVGQRIAGGEGDDWDVGTIDEIVDDQVTISWDSLVVTTQPSVALHGCVVV